MKKPLFLLLILVLTTGSVEAQQRRKADREYERAKDLYHKFCGDIDKIIIGDPAKVEQWCRNMARIMRKRGDLPKPEKWTPY